MSKVVAEIAIGVALVALDVLAPEIGLALTPMLSSFLISVGASLVLSGIGSLLSPQTGGLATSVRNAVQPWNAVYGRAKLGGVIVYIEETGSKNKYLHLVYVLACHACQSVDQLLFDGQQVLLNSSGDSFYNGQQSANIHSISRTNDVVTLKLASAILNLDGTTVQIQNVGDHTYNGQYMVTQSSDDLLTLTYICGGNPGSSSGGQVRTMFPNYGTNVHMETLLGNQTSTFPTLLAQSNGLWTSAHLLSGRTAVYLRLQYSINLFPNGMPTISFLVHGKNDIFDPRTNVVGYTENSALCIADYLAQPKWGFKALYGTEIPTAPLITAANICDELVPLYAGGTEPRYTCNGAFSLATKRGEILQNMLTSCGGRLTYTGGQFIIWPAYWPGVMFSVGPPSNAPIPFAEGDAARVKITESASATSGGSAVGVVTYGSITATLLSGGCSYLVSTSPNTNKPPATFAYAMENSEGARENQGNPYSSDGWTDPYVADLDLQYNTPQTEPLKTGVRLVGLRAYISAGGSEQQTCSGTIQFVVNDGYGNSFTYTVSASGAQYNAGQFSGGSTDMSCSIPVLTPDPSWAYPEDRPA